MKTLFKILDPQCMIEDALEERIEQEVKVVQQINFLGYSIICILLSILIMFFCIYQSSKIPPRPTFGVQLEKGFLKGNPHANPLISLPFPHQSLKNVSGWLLTALNTIYGVSFDNIEEKIKSAEYYFTPEGYSSYLKALETSGFKSDVIKKKLKITLLATQDPVLINGGFVGDLEFWRLRVPVLISYLGGKEIVTNQKMIEVLIVRVPAYKNEKGLSISEFIMGTI
jgi:hypothetical protein